MKTIKIVLRFLLVISIIAIALLIFSSGRLYEDILKEGSLKDDFTIASVVGWMHSSASMFFSTMIKFLLGGLLLRLAIILIEKKEKMKNKIKVWIAIASIPFGLLPVLIKFYKSGELDQITVTVTIVLLGLLTVVIGLWPNLSIRFFNWILARPKLVLEENKQENS